MFKSNSAALVAALFLAACSNTVITPHQFPIASASTTGGRAAGPSFAAVRDLSVPGATVRAAVADPVSFSDLPLCQASQIVLGSNLSVPFTCSGEGLVSVSVPSSSPKTVLDAFVTSVQRAGGSVRVSDGVVAVRGREGSATAQQASVASSAAAGAASPGFNPAMAPSPIGKPALVDVQLDAREVTMITDAGGEEGLIQARAIADTLGVDVSAELVKDRLVLVGNSTDIHAIKAVFAWGEEVTVPIDVGAISDTAVESLKAVYPDLVISYDPALRTLWVRGARDNVMDAYGIIKSRIPASRDIRIAAAFVDVNYSKLSRVRSDPARGVIEAARAAQGGTILAGLDVGSIVDVVRSSSAASVKSEPVVTVSAGRQAEFISGQRLPVVAGVSDEGRQAFEYVDTGVVVRATPYLLPNGRIKLDLHLEVSGPSGTGANGNPIISTRAVTSSIEVASGDTVAISALSDERRGASNGRKFGLFPSKDGSDSNGAIVFYVTATIER